MKILTGKNTPSSFPIGMVVSRFNEKITERLLNGAVARLQQHKIPQSNIVIVKVPGAIEIPIVAQRLALTENFAAIICLGAVIYGETPHFDYVCQQVSHGCQEVALEQNIPVIFGVLTTETEQQALDRSGGKRGHMGHEAVDSALEMISVLEQINKISVTGK